MSSVTNEIFWLTENSNYNRDKAISSVRRNDEKEMKEKTQGWRWVRINSQHKIYIPCDEDGNPTKEGVEKIQRFKEHLTK